MHPRFEDRDDDDDDDEVDDADDDFKISESVRFNAFCHVTSTGALRA